jgi:hypothetical protein
LYPSAKENSKNKWYAFYKFIYLKKLWSHKYPYTRLADQTSQLTSQNKSRTKPQTR